MRVLHVTSGNLYGGVERVLTTIAQLSPTPVESEFAVCWDGRLSSELTVTGQRVVTLGPARLSRPLQSALARRRLRRAIRAGSYDAVILHSLWSQSLFGRVVRQSGVPSAVWIHDAIRGGHWIHRVAARRAPDLVIANSHYTARTVPLVYPNVPVEVVYCPVAIDRGVDGPIRTDVRSSLDTGPDVPVVLQVGRLERWKGHRSLLRALGALGKEVDWVCWIVGGAQRPSEQEYLDELTQLARDLGIEHRVRFAGHRSDIPAVMEAADVFCQVNEEPEPFGLVFVEAMQARLPVIASSAGGALEIVTPDTGVLLRSMQTSALADAIGSLLSDAQRRRSLGDAGRERALALCDPDRQMAHLHKVLESVVKK